MLPLVVLALGVARPPGLLFAVDGPGLALECYGREGGGLRRLSRVGVPGARYLDLLAVDAPRRLVFLRAWARPKAAGRLAAFRYDAGGRLFRLAETPVEAALEALAFDPTGAFAALVGPNGARTCRVMPDGTLVALAGSPLRGSAYEEPPLGVAPYWSRTEVAPSGDGRRLFALTSTGSMDIRWSYVNGYAWGPEGRLAKLPFRVFNESNWDEYRGLAPDRRGRFVFEVGGTGERKAGWRLDVARSLKGRGVPGPSCRAAAYDDARRGLYVVEGDRLDWVSDRRPSRRRTIGRLGFRVRYAARVGYDAVRRELVVVSLWEPAARVGVYAIGPGLRVVKRLEASLGKGRGPALWVP